MARLSGKVAVVTGAGQGIGRGIARCLAAEGAAVVLAGRTVAKVAEVAAEIEAKGGAALALACDVNLRAQVDDVIAATVARFGPPDVLVNNAQGGGQGTGSLAAATDEQFLAAFRGGALSTLYGMQACLPHMRDRGGTIVNMGSSTGVLGDPGFAPYGTAKEAVRALTKHAAREWGRYGITVNVICPAARSESAKAFEDKHPERWRAVLREIPLGRMGEPDDDIGPSVVALATDLHYLTGATLMLDGGRCILR